jgi:transposase
MYCLTRATTARYGLEIFISMENRRTQRKVLRAQRYIRTLLNHGARSVLRSATVAHRTGREIDRLKHWALEV